MQFARAAASNQEDIIDSTHQFLMILSQLPAVRGRDAATCQAFMAGLLKEYPRYAQIGVIGPDGVASCRAIPLPDTAPTVPGHYYERVLATRDFAAGDFEVGRVTGKSALAFGYPIVEADGEIQQVVFVALDLAALNQLAAQALLPAGSTLVAIDHNGTIVARYPNPENWVGRTAAEVPIVKQILAREGEGTLEAVGEDNVSRLYAFAPLRSVPGNNIFVSVGIPTQVAFADVNEALTRDFWTLGLVATLALGAAWFGGDWFLLRHMNALVDATTRLADGDLSARAGKRQYGVEELSQLATAFDKMGQALEQRDAERKRAEEDVRLWSAQLEALINAVAEAISQPSEASRIPQIALGRLHQILALDAGCIFRKRGDGFALVAHRGLDRTVVSRLEHVAGDDPALEIVGLARRAPVESPSIPPPSPDANGHWVCVPIQSKGRVLGLLCMARADRRLLEAPVRGVLAAVGQQIGVAIENAELYEQVQSIAAVKERERLSRELHDGLAQVLGYLCLRNKFAIDLIAGGQVANAAAQLHEMQNAMQDSYRDVRESILGLRVTVSSSGGLVSALNEYIVKFGLQTGIRVNLVANAQDRIELSPETEVQLLRIVQEALTNIRRHSNAKQAWVRFESATGALVVTIEDDGRGFDPAALDSDGQPHYGLQTMRERAEGVRGSLQVTSRIGEGTRIVVTMACP